MLFFSLAYWSKVTLDFRHDQEMNRGNWRLVSKSDAQFIFVNYVSWYLFTYNFVKYSFQRTINWLSRWQLWFFFFFNLNYFTKTLKVISQTKATPEILILFWKYRVSIVYPSLQEAFFKLNFRFFHANLNELSHCHRGIWLNSIEN